MLIDTHCHLHDREFFTEEQAEEMLARAREKGVEKIICIGTSEEDSLAAREFAEKHPGVYWTYGIHPENAVNHFACRNSKRHFSDTGFAFGNSFRARPPAVAGAAPLISPRASDIVLKMPFLNCDSQSINTEEAYPYPLNTLSDTSPIAIGEVGLDYHYPGYDRKAQIRLFEEMLQLATDLELPMSFHVREAFEDFLPVVGNFPEVRGVVHSFSDNKKNLRKILEQTEFYVGVNGMATYSTLPMPPMERILLETDAPFLTPKPFRGIINESGYVLEIATWLSEKLAVDLEVIERETTKNARELFHF